MANGENGNGKYYPTWGMVFNLVVVLVGLGVGWGKLNTEVDNLKVSRDEAVISRAKMYDKLDQIELRLIRIEAAAVADRERERRRVAAIR